MPTQLISEEEIELFKKLEPIAQKWAVMLRRADNIDHDPEGQRMKAHIAAACLEAYRMAIPADDGKTTLVTEAPTGEDNGKPISVHGGHSDGKRRPRNQGQ